MNAPLLQINGLHVAYKVYGTRHHVLNGISISVEKGEKVGIIGESGCGKTTTLKSVLRILPSNALIEGGEILYDSKNVLKMDGNELRKLRRTKVSMIFQDPTAALNPVFKIGEQLFDIIRAKYEDGGRSLTSKEIREEAEMLIRQVMLPEPERILSSYPFQLSGGMRQRVMIAMALASASELLLADEPTTNLDVTIQDQILRLIDRIVNEKKLSIVLVSHALGAVRKMVNRVYVMYAGTIVEEGRTRDVFENPLHPYTKMLLASAPKLTGEGISEGIPGRIPDYSSPPPGCRFHPRCPSATPACRFKEPKMVEVEPNHRVACYLYSMRGE
ncbi:MAG: peptide ABC transporter ATP-binding protein [Fervidicoccus sp.]|nr:MAG: peptide ABC transporter ATP-binding protein [Fervidicoccus sp.]